MTGINVYYSSQHCEIIVKECIKINIYHSRSHIMNATSATLQNLFDFNGVNETSSRRAPISRRHRECSDVHCNDEEGYACAWNERDRVCTRIVLLCRTLVSYGAVAISVFGIVVRKCHTDRSPLQRLDNDTSQLKKKIYVLDIEILFSTIKGKDGRTFIKL